MCLVEARASQYKHFLKEFFLVTVRSQVYQAVISSLTILNLLLTRLNNYMDAPRMISLSDACCRPSQDVPKIPIDTDSLTLF